MHLGFVPQQMHGLRRRHKPSVETKYVRPTSTTIYMYRRVPPCARACGSMQTVALRYDKSFVEKGLVNKKVSAYTISPCGQTLIRVDWRNLKRSMTNVPQVEQSLNKWLLGERLSVGHIMNSRIVVRH